MSKTVRVRVPATTANLGPGFDCLGLALQLYNTVELIGDSSELIVKNQKFKIEIEGEGENSLPKNEENIVYQATKIVFDKTASSQQPAAIRLKLVNRIPLARGLGSSAAARIGGLVAANKLCGNKLTVQEILNIATQLEGHPDNVVPAFFGGLCVSSLDKNRVKYVKLNTPVNLKAIVCIPELTISTEKARKILPHRVPLKDAVFNSSRVALLISALNQRRYDLLKSAMEDRLHQPYREKLIPGMKEVFQSAYSAGALGVALSGSGSSILALSKEQRPVRRSIGEGGAKSKKIGQAMIKAFKREGIKSRYLILGIEQEGVKIV